MYQIASLLVSCFILVICSCSSRNTVTDELPYYNTADFTPIFLDANQDYQIEIPHQINDFSFINQKSEPVTNKHIEGKIHVANFMFTSCGSICPSMTNNLKLVNDAFANEKQVLILSFSVTPWIDDSERLLAYKQQYEIFNDNWHFLTGNKAEIYQLARQSYFAEDKFGFSKDSSDFLHTEHVLLVDQTKRIRGIYNGTLALEMQQLIKDIKNLNQQ